MPIDASVARRKAADPAGACLPQGYGGGARGQQQGGSTGGEDVAPHDAAPVPRFRAGTRARSGRAAHRSSHSRHASAASAGGRTRPPQWEQQRSRARTRPTVIESPRVMPRRPRPSPAANGMVVLLEWPKRMLPTAKIPSTIAVSNQREFVTDMVVETAPGSGPASNGWPHPAPAAPQPVIIKDEYRRSPHGRLHPRHRTLPPSRSLSGTRPITDEGRGCGDSRSRRSCCSVRAARRPPPRSPAGRSMLFIGDSLTYTNDPPAMVEQVADAAGDSVRIGMSASRHAHHRPHRDRRRRHRADRESEWAYVVLQQGRRRPASVGTRWSSPRCAWRRGSGGVDDRCCPTVGRRSFPQSLAAAGESATAAARRSAAPWYPSGIAWKEALDADGDLPLYSGDGYHRSSRNIARRADHLRPAVGRDVREYPPASLATIAGVTLSRRTW